MTKKIITFSIIFLLPIILKAQTDQTHKLFSGKYFQGKYLYCETDNADAKIIFEAGFNRFGFDNIGDIHNTKSDLNYYKLLFMNVIAKDTLFCDAYFFAGYVSDLLDEDIEAFAYYYMADSLCASPSIIFKQNLASAALDVNNIEIAHKKYDELIRHFPNSPEGYYGKALIAAIAKKIRPENGMEYLNKANQLYEKTRKVRPIYIRMVEAISLMRIGELQKAEKIFRKIRTMHRYKNRDVFNANYAECLYRLGHMNNDKKMLKKYKLYLKKVKNKKLLGVFLLENQFQKTN